MGESYNVLKAKYQRLIVAVKEIEQQRDMYIEELESIKEYDKQIEKNVRLLCETILKKDREIIKEGKNGEKNKPWFKMGLLDLIMTSQTSLENYFPRLKTQIENVMKVNADKCTKIGELEDKIEQIEIDHQKELKRKDEIIQNLGTGSKVSISDAFRDMKPINEEEQINAINTSFIGEDDDEIGDIMESAASYITEVEVPDTIPEAIDTVIPESVRKRAEEAILDTKESIDSNISIIKNTIKEDPTRVMVLKVIGETGISSQKELVDYIKERKIQYEKQYGIEKLTDTKVQNITQNLSKASKYRSGKSIIILERKAVSLYGAPNGHKFYFTEDGKQVYKALFGSEPVKSEYEIIVSNHATPEHGYGIKAAGTCLEECKAIKNRRGTTVSYLTRTDNFKVKLPDGRTYIPDIVIEYPDGTNTKYIEYETGKCQLNDFIEKCDKITSFYSYIYIIVPDATALSETEKKFKAWVDKLYDRKEFPTVESIHLRINTLKQLSDQKRKDTIEWAVKEDLTKNTFDKVLQSKLS